MNIRLTLSCLVVLFTITAKAQYSEPFSTPNKGYLLNFVDDLAGVNWTMTPWNTGAGERDAADYFNTTATAGGVMESIDLDQEVCWESPLLQIGAAGMVTLSVDLTWAGFDSDAMANNCITDYIRVMYSINGGAYTMVANQFGGNACATVGYPFQNPGGTFNGSGTVTQGGISGSTLKIRVCVFTNANAELVTIDNVSVPQAGVSLNCSQPVLTTTQKNIVCNGAASGSIDLTVSGGSGSGYTYDWSNDGAENPDNDTQDLSSLVAGTYTVTVTDGASCTQTASVTITSAPIVQSAVTFPASCGGPTGAIDLTVSGGNPGYSYVWTNGATTQDISALPAGSYTVTVTDSSVPPCTSTASYMVAALANGPYSETFSVPNKGYLINQVNNFFGVNWTLSPWTLDEPPAGNGRDNGDYFATTAGGKLEGLDSDQEICWISPEINTMTSGTFQFSVDLTWAGFDNEDYILVQYSLNGGAFTTIPNLVGGGAGTIQYAFPSVDQNGSGTVTQTGLTANKIQIRVCFLTNSQADIVTIDNISIPQPVTLCFAPILSTVQTNVSCNGGSNGAINLTVTGGSSPYTYDWSNDGPETPDNDTEDLTGLVAGTYTVTVTDMVGATSTASVTITQPSAIVLTTSVVNVSCNGGSNGSIDLGVTGGTPGYTYTWTGGATTQDRTGLVAGTYTVTVTDANGCTATTSATVTQPTALSLSSTTTNVTCAGGSNGAIDLTVSGGTPGYTYDWSNDGADTPDNDTQDLTDLTTGTYTVTVTDANGCTATTSQTITANPLPILFAVTGGGTYCDGNGVVVGLNGSEVGVNYQLLVNAVPTGSPFAGTGAAFDFPGLQTAAGTYTVVATNPMTTCTNTMTGAVQVATAVAPVVNAPTIIQPSIAYPNGSITVNATGGPTLEYKINSGPYQLSNIFNGLEQDSSYSIFVRLQNSVGCEVAYSGNPVEMNAVAARFSCQPDVLIGTSPFQDSMWHIDLSTGSVIRRLGPTLSGFTITGMNGLATHPLTGEHYILMKVSGITGRLLGKVDIQTGVCTSVGNTGDNFSSITFHSDGTLYGATGNGATVPEALYELNPMNAAKTLLFAMGNGADGEVICYNPDDDHIYHWSGNSTMVFEKFPSTAVAYTPVNIPITGTPGGETFGAIYRGSNKFIISNIASNLREVTLTPGGATYGPVLTNNPDDLRGLIKETCISSITVEGLPVVCQQDSVTLTVIGGVSNYQWYMNGVLIPGATNPSYNALNPGLYNAIYTDECGITDSLPQGIILTTASNPILATIATPTCFGDSVGAIDLTVSGGASPYTYDWSNDGPENPDNDMEDISGLNVGEYFVTVTDANLCSATISDTITALPQIVLTTVVVNVGCNGDSTGSVNLTVTGGTPGYTFVWSNGATTEDISNLPTGIYFVTVTDAANCSAFTVVNITEPAAIILTTTAQNVLCNGDTTGSIVLTVNGGTPDYTFLWSNGDNTQNITGLLAGTYTVTVTDDNGCTQTTSQIVTEPLLLTLSTTQTNVGCNGGASGAIDLTVNGGTPDYTYDWSNDGTETPDNDSQNINDLVAGVYMVTVTDANGCTATTSVTITEPDAIAISGVVSPACQGISNGAIDISVTGGTPAYSYAWSNGAQTQDINGLPAGGYTVTVTDANFCSDTASFLVNESSPILLTTVASASCAGSSIGAIDLTVSGGTMPYTYDWSNDGAETPDNDPQDLNGVVAGIYFVTVTDVIGCTAVAVDTINEVPTPNVNVISNQTYCAGSTVPSIIFTSNVPGATFAWSRTNEAIGLGANSGTGNIPSFTAANAGVIPLTSTFSVVASYTSDGITCTGTPIQFTITVNPNPQVNAVASQTYCVGSSVPSVVFTSSVPGAVFSWSRTNEAIGLGVNSGTGNVPAFTAANAGVTPLTATFSVVASFTNNGVTCTGTPIQFTITVNPNPQVNAVVNQTYCAGAIVPSVVFTSNVPGAVFAWSRTNEAIGLAANSGNGNIPSFTATNAGVTPLTSTFSVVASFTNNGVTCTGTPIQFTITINPLPTINPVVNQTYCAGSNVPSIVFTSNVPGVVFNWTRTSEPIGLAPTNGTGSVPAFTATNTGNGPITSTFMATASFTNNGVTCTSAPIQFTITINPNPIVTPVPNQTYCVGAVVPSTLFFSNVLGSVFTWSRTGDDIGLGPVSGTGPIPSFTGVNTTTGPLTATFTVIATYTNNGVSCSGPPITFTITICYPLMPGILGDAYVCPGEIETYFIENYNPNSTYTWILQNGGGVIIQDNGSNIVIEWQDQPGGPFMIQLEEAGCGDVCQTSAFLPVYIQGVETISCNDHVQISIGAECETVVLSGMVLEGEAEGNDNYYVVITDLQGNIIPNATLTADHIGQTLIVTVLNECNGQSCSGTINVEDKIAPVIECTDVTVSCGSSLEPVYEPPVTGSITGTEAPGSPIGPNAGTVTTTEIILDVPANAVVTDVDITIDLNHTWVGDLTVELISPAGTSVLLVDQICGAVDNWDNVTFDDEAGLLVTTACNPIPPALAGSVVPQGSLATIDGQSAVGAWTLVITDQVGGDGGTLNEVALNVDYYLAVPSAPFASDACGEVTLTYTDSQSGDDCEELLLTRTWTATDGSGNTATCVQNITITPLTLENVDFPAAYEGVCGESILPQYTGWPTVDGVEITDESDLCNIFVGYWDKELNECGGGRKIVRTWTVLDWCAVEIVEAVQVIKLVDNVGPELTCPADFEVGTDFWYCYANVSVPKPVAIDECSEIASYSLTSSSGIIVSFGNNYVINGLELGTHTVTWTVSDECGNSSTCSFEITVVDDVVPVANCDQHTIVSLTNDGPSGITLVPASVFDDGSYDNCGPVTFRARRMDSCIDIDWTTEGACIDDVPGGIPAVNSRDRGTVHRPCVPFACCDVGAGPIMVELEVTDAAGNVNYCMVEATVQDKISPFVECPSDIIVSCDFWFNVEEGTFVDGEGNNDGSLDEDPLSAVFGNMYDAFRYDESIRGNIIINDPGNEAYNQPYNWGLEGWADDNCQVNLSVRVRVIDDCSGDDLPGNAPDGAVKLIERRFTAADGNEGIAPGTCTQRIWVVDYDPFYITDQTCSNSNNQDGVIWPCDVLLTTCPEDLGNTGEPTIFDDACSLIGVTYEDQRFDFVDGACFKILREWAVIDWCQYDAQTGEGLWHYTQVIKVHDEEGPQFVAPCETQVLCVADEGVSLPDNNQAFLGENNPLASSCSVHLNLSRTVHETCSDVVNYDVKIYPFNGTEYILIKPTATATVDENNDAVLSFDTRQSSIQSIRLNGLPYNSQFCGDYHRILWSVEDGCGNWSHCEYLIRLEDCKQPSPVCINGLSTVVMPVGGQVTVWAKDFNASSFDDCTPSEELLYSFSGDTYTPSYTYTCENVPAFNTELSTQIWVADAGTDDNCNGLISWNERNKDYCTTTIVITDNAGVCDTSGPIVGSVLAGEVFTEDLQPVENVGISINAPGHVFPTYLTTNNGQYAFSGLVIPENFTVQAARNDNHRNGVSTLDLVKIQKHLLGIETMNSPYDLIAADANNSESVSAIDLIELRKLILGIYTALPANTSWRFVDKQFQFADADNPWPFSEYINMPGMSEDEMDEDFVAIKVGDVNNTVQANALQILPRNGNDIVNFVAEDRAVAAGEMVEIEIRSADFAGIEGYQFTMEANGLEFRGVESGLVSMTDENVGLFGSTLTASWHKVGGVSATASDVLFTLSFQATTAGQLSEMININSKVTEAEAYNTSSDIKDLKLTFRGSETGAEFALYQNEPNPFKGTTTIGYDLPEAGNVVLTVFDVTGKVVFVKEQTSVKGYNTIAISSKEMAAVGVMYYRLDANEYTATKKMVIIE